MTYEAPDSPCRNCGFERRDHDPLGLCPDAPSWPELPPRKFRAREAEEVTA